MNRNYNIDLLKLLGCFGVVVLHCAGKGVDSWNEYNLRTFLYFTACYSVPIFFMVNGYLLLNKRDISYKYILKKVINILTVVFGWNVCIFIINLIIKGEVNNPLKGAIKNLIQQDYFWQFWFFGALIIIYLVLPFIYKYIFSNSKRAAIFTAFLVGICFIFDSFEIYRLFIGKKIFEQRIIQTFRIWTWFAYYLLGGFIGKNKCYIISKINRKANLITCIIFCFLISMYQYTISKTFKIVKCEFFYDNILTFLFVISLFIYILNINIKKIKLINIISENIMGIYILHVTIIKIAVHLYAFDYVISNTILVLIVFLISLILSIIINRIPLMNKLIRI